MISWRVEWKAWREAGLGEWGSERWTVFASAIVEDGEVLSCFEDGFLRMVGGEWMSGGWAYYMTLAFGLSLVLPRKPWFGAPVIYVICA